VSFSRAGRVADSTLPAVSWTLVFSLAWPQLVTQKLLSTRRNQWPPFSTRNTVAKAEHCSQQEHGSCFPSFPHAHCSSNESTVHVSKHRSLSYARRGTVAPKKILFIRENTPATAAAFDMWSPRFLDRSLPLHAPNERRLFFSMHVR